MPFYEYRCRNCGQAFEEFVRSLFSQAKPVCPKCGSQESEKIVSLCGSSSRSSGSSVGAANCAPTGG